MKRIICTILTLIMIVGLFSATAFATSSNGNALGNTTANSQLTALRAQLTANHKDKVLRLDLIRKIVALKKQLNDKSISVFVDGQDVKFDVPPVIRYGRTLLPVRAIMNSLGATVVWSSATKEVTVTKAVYSSVYPQGEMMTVVFKLESKEVIVNTLKVTIDYPAILISNRTFVPIRFLAEIFGKKVDWDKLTGSVIIDDEDKDDVKPTHTPKHPATATPTPTPAVTPTPSPTP